jgi:hypothetical protein
LSVSDCFMASEKLCKDCRKAKGNNCQWRKDFSDRTGCPQVWYTLDTVIKTVRLDTRVRRQIGVDILSEAEGQCDQWIAAQHSRETMPLCDGCDDSGEVWAEIGRREMPYTVVYLAPRPCPLCAMGAVATVLYRERDMPTDAPKYRYGPVPDSYWFTRDARPGRVAARNQYAPLEDVPKLRQGREPGEGLRRIGERDGKAAAGGE